MSEEPTSNDPGADEEQPERPEAEEPAAEQLEPPAEPGAATEEQLEPEEALAEDAATEGDDPAQAEAPPADEAAPVRRAAEQPPGAELEPIAIEPEVELDAEERARLEAEAEERARREAELEAVEHPVAAKPAKLAGDARYAATGKRKSSVARVILSQGDGAIEINSRNLEEYFPRAYLQSVAKQPLVQTGYEDSVNVRVRVHGGGISGQAAAVRHGIARALCDVDPELRRELKRRGMLTRDARIKERRKAGLKKARKRPQFSKR